MLGNLLRNDEDKAAARLVRLLHGGVGAREREVGTRLEKDVNHALARVERVVVDVQSVHARLFGLTLLFRRRLDYRSRRRACGGSVYH